MRLGICVGKSLRPVKTRWTYSAFIWCTPAGACANCDAPLNVGRWFEGRFFFTPPPLPALGAIFGINFNFPVIVNTAVLQRIDEDKFRRWCSALGSHEKKNASARSLSEGFIGGAPLNDRARLFNHSRLSFIKSIVQKIQKDILTYRFLMISSLQTKVNSCKIAPQRSQVIFENVLILYRNG